ncbi:MAG: carboxylating nicotinate-nucleotide diphosphorylase [Phycisphaerales bacterium]
MTIDLNALALPDLYAHLRSSGLVTRLFELARDEDLAPEGGERACARGDVTSLATVASETRRTTARVVARRAGTIAGLAAVDDLLHAFRADVDFTPAAHDGQTAAPGQTLGTLKGNQRAILGLERTLLNTLGRLSGIATHTAEFAALVAGTPAAVFDTRKTTPGLRVLEKYAVRCGGGRCHRLGLFDAALIKDNHLSGVPLADLARFVRRAVSRALDEAGPGGLRFVEVEVDTLDQFRAILEGGGCGAGIILLDNMHPAELRQAVALRQAAGLRIELEASGGITRENLRAVAETGVDRISLGTLTHGATWLDLGLDAES